MQNGDANGLWIPEVSLAKPSIDCKVHSPWSSDSLCCAIQTRSRTAFVRPGRSRRSFAPSLRPNPRGHLLQFRDKGVLKQGQLSHDV